jgi:hypothetical protein
VARKLILIAAAAVALTACSSQSGPHLSPDQQDGLAPTRAETSVLQFFIDSGGAPQSDVTSRPSAVANGIVAMNVVARLLYQAESNAYLGPARTVSVGSEAARAGDLIQQVPGLQSSQGRPKGKPALTPDQAASAVVVQALSDAGYLDGRSFGAPAKGGMIQPGAAVYAWVAAHGADPLAPGVTTTVATEKQRVLDFIQLPLPSPSAG